MHVHNYFFCHSAAHVSGGDAGEEVRAPDSEAALNGECTPPCWKWEVERETPTAMSYARRAQSKRCRTSPQIMPETKQKPPWSTRKQPERPGGSWALLLQLQLGRLRARHAYATALRAHFVPKINTWSLGVTVRRHTSNKELRSAHHYPYSQQCCSPHLCRPGQKQAEATAEQKTTEFGD